MSTRRRAIEQPASIKIQARYNIDNETAEQFLTECLDNEGLGASDALKAQMKRVQRDLRGLPPLARKKTESDSINNNDNDNEEQMMDIDEVMGVEAEEKSEKELSKEEKKKLKQQRRLEEKKKKAEANRKKNEGGEEEEADSEE